MGLGLSITRSIMDAHGGTLSGENRPDGGAVFRIVLPRADVEESAPLPIPSTLAGGLAT
jgi:two-component system sensor kinase FixL